MFREMRRKSQALSFDECAEILNRGTSGVLALSGDNQYPYAVPLSYVYDNTKIYFHCAQEGHKIDSILRNAKASFCVIDQDQIIPEKYTTYFRSVIAFGTIRILHDSEQKRTAIEKLTQKYVPNGGISNLKQAIDQEWEGLCMLEMAIKHLTGKEAIELAKRKIKPGV